MQVKPYELTPQGHIERDLCDYEQRIIDAMEVRCYPGAYQRAVGPSCVTLHSHTAMHPRGSDT